MHGSPQSLSVFNAPTATFMWPDFQSSSQMGTVPKIYVDYNRDRPPPEEPIHALHRSSSGYAVSESSEEASPTLSQKRKPSTDLPRPEKKTSLNNILEPFKSLDSSAPRRRILMNSTRRKIQIAHQRSASPEPQVGQSSRTSHPTQPIQKPNYQAQFVPRHDHSPRQEDRSPESPEDSRTLGTPSGHSESVSTIMTSSFKNEEEWETSAQPFKAPDGSAKWQASCLWKTYDNGKECLCMYTAKKQLVKRHVETTHLKYRPFVCSICDKKFPQKTSLDTHMHGHTGATPHDCRFEGCGLSFKDPARRHRHMVEEHNYKPKPSQRRQKSGQGLGDAVQFESMTSWAGDD
ncbi:hypothetical protein FIBSPDRAFT_1046967 [Athelia psychrophila]|uniref:C2H2-type domain-containing protein n=1 Tax=Athelia psychrophila TaxID=1759441 RepID=A0A166FY20_9AGAM|nr:hypothetical protein FIBSPDRAFT_1046967 [Fibularhizoctonia sp. CBS 109695]